MNDIKILDIPLSHCRILYDGGVNAAATVAQKLQEWIARQCGVRLPVAESKEHTPAKGCILLAPLPHATYGEGVLCAREGCVCLQGNDILGLTEAAAFLAGLLSRADAPITEEALCYHATLEARERYVADATAFLPCYRHAQIVPAWELTLGEKRRALNDPTGRPFVIAHRGEHVFYPENSLEGALSAWRGGADSVEVDIQKSADGVWVCMHDTDVTRTTNAGELLGHSGFPTSPLLCDWTLDQLRALRLKDAYGAQTPFPIPTLAEILHACNGRIFVHLDKAFSVTEDIFPYMEELGIYDCVYLVNHVGINEILQHKDHFADRGIRLENLTRPRREMTLEKTLPLLLENLSHTTPAIIPVGDYVALKKDDFALIAQYRDKLRFGAWFLRDFDYEALWLEAHAQGIRIFMTDHPLDLIALQL